MLVLLLKRLARAPVVLFLLITVSFFLMRLAPGGPFSREKQVDPETRKVLEARYHLDAPVHRQYLIFLGDLLRADFGSSLKHRERTVNEIIARGLPKSALLGGLALLLALVIGCTAGLVSALMPGRIPDYAAMGGAILGISLPTFVIGPLLQMGFAMRVDWFPVAGWGEGVSPAHLALPAVTLALPFGARIARLMRAGMLDVMTQDYICVARAKGLRESTVITRHALWGGVLPVVSFLGPAVAMILTGSLVVEKIFQIPGMGREFVEGALNRDYPVVMATVIVYGTLIIVCNLLVDLAYAVLDPRVRTE